LNLQHSADLSQANLGWAHLNTANLAGANLKGARLLSANLFGANLTNADLCKTMLVATNLSLADLTGADLTETVLTMTTFGSTALTRVQGLDRSHYQGPSNIDFQTLKNSVPLPLAFLRGIGLPDHVIEYPPSLLNEATQHYSCFISHSSKDQTFAERLHADLQNKGVRCWFAPHDMPIGAKIIDAIDEAIRVRDKVLLILSEGAIASDWVEGEVTRALDEERTRKQVVLFPVRLDDAVMQTSEGWARLLRGQRNIGDFTRWKDHDSYQKELDRLMRDLRVEKPDQSQVTDASPNARR
jgi:TIR domain-containing protein/pentapeptide repeat protein